MAALVFVLLAACQPLPSSNAEQGADKLLFDRDGIAIVDVGLRVDFGRAQDGTVESVSRLIGTAPTSVTELRECGSGPLVSAAWSDGLTLLFQDGDFRGWLSEDARWMSGALRVGATPPGSGSRTTSIGQEYSADGVFALVPPGEDRITITWAGVNCFFR